VKVIAKYGDVDTGGWVYICEAHDIEIGNLGARNLAIGDEVERPDIKGDLLEVHRQIEKARSVLRYAQRSEALVKMLNSELELARLSVNDKQVPDLNAIRALIEALKIMVE
jgi:hypothetical protein